MSEPAVPFTSEGSILAWKRESSRGSTPSLSSAWNSYGRVTQFQSLGPEHSIFGDHIIGAGQNPHEVGYEGTTYGPASLSFQIRDPLILGYVFSKEKSRSQIGSTGFYRHTLEYTDKAELDSFTEAEVAQKADGTIEAIGYNETVVPQLSVRGEEPSEDGGSGRTMAALTRGAHDEDTSSTWSNLSVNLESDEPYRFHHGHISFEGQQVFRITEFELTFDRRASPAFYIRDDEARTPAETVPEGAQTQLNVTGVADDQQITVNGTDYTVRELLINRVPFDATFKFTRTADEDEFQFNLTEIPLANLPLSHSQGKVTYEGGAPWVREAEMQYVDSNDSAHFST